MIAKWLQLLHIFGTTTILNVMPAYYINCRTLITKQAMRNSKEKGVLTQDLKPWIEKKGWLFSRRSKGVHFYINVVELSISTFIFQIKLMGYVHLDDAFPNT